MVEEEEVNKLIDELKEPLTTIESGWFRWLNSRKLDSLCKLYNILSKKTLNRNCYNCIKEGLKYVRAELYRRKSRQRETNDSTENDS